MKKCRFFDYCPLRQLGCRTCESEHAIKNYYGNESPAGCYRKMENTVREIIERFSNEPSNLL